MRGFTDVTETASKFARQWISFLRGFDFSSRRLWFGPIQQHGSQIIVNEHRRFAGGERGALNVIVAAVQVLGESSHRRNGEVDVLALSMNGE